MEFDVVEKRKKVRYGLMVCSDNNKKCIECPYHPAYTGDTDCSNHLCKDALDLLKELENEVEPIISRQEDGSIWCYCGKCGYMIERGYQNYCSVCGTKIKGKD